VTTKERLHKLVDELSESEAEDALKYAESRREGANIDEWGNLDSFGQALMGDSLRRLDEEERATFGESIGEAWQRQSPT
jgi:hypothetical protein